MQKKTRVMIVAAVLCVASAAVAAGPAEMDTRMALVLQQPEKSAALRQTLEQRLAAAASDAEKTGIAARLTLLSAFEALPASVKLSRYEQVVLNTQILDQLSNLARLDAAAEQVNSMRNQYWAQLSAFAGEQQAEASRVSNLQANEFIIAQFAGPLKGKLAIVELVGDRSAQTYRWQQVETTSLPAKILPSAGPLQLNLQQIAAPVVVVFEGAGLSAGLQNQTHWLDALAMAAPLLFLELSPEHLAQTQEALAKANRYVLPATGKNKPAVSLVDTRSALVLASWPLEKLTGEHGKKLRSFINELLTIAKQLEAAQ
ncbi:MAG: hypothetical protein Q4G66_10785 [bacterium]|nr:hypothetical protein [bacterium]